MRNERIAGRWETTKSVSDWFWVEQPLTSSEIVGLLGHDRWKIENEGFNELITHWHANHYFHHHTNSILVLWLMLFMAHAIFHCFHKRNLKPAQRQNRTVIYFAKLMAASLRCGNWWPPPTSPPQQHNTYGKIPLLIVIRSIAELSCARLHLPDRSLTDVGTRRDRGNFRALRARRMALRTCPAVRTRRNVRVSPDFKHAPRSHATTLRNR